MSDIKNVGQTWMSLKTFKGEVSSKMTYIFYWPVRISIFLENSL